MCVHPHGIDAHPLSAVNVPFEIVSNHPGVGRCHTEDIEGVQECSFIRFTDPELFLNLDVIEEPGKIVLVDLIPFDDKES